MIESIQRFIQDACLSVLGLIGGACILYWISVTARRFFARSKAIGLAALLTLAAVAAVILGGGKSEGEPLAKFPPAPQTQLVPLSPDVGLTNHVHSLVVQSPRASATMPFRAAKWNVRGAWNDSFRYAFADGWDFPFGTGHLDRVEVCSQGRVIPRYGSTDVIADVGVPLQIVNPITSFGCGPTDRNSCIFSWTNAVVGRVLHENIASAETINASIELFRNGDVAITTNGITELIPRVLPFPHDGFGQDDDWVSGNFTNAAEILSIGYPQWVDAQVGENLTNGLYKFTVTIPEVPPEAIQLVVGDYSVAVTNSGDYVFLLEKGVDYPYGTFPFLASVTYSAVDDVPQTRGGMRASEVEGTMHRWTVDGGYGINPQTDSALGLVWWMPVFFGSPDVPHLGPDDGALTFTANFSDCRVEPAASYSWTASDGLTVASPSAKATQISADTMPSWAQATVSVTATVGDHTLRSDLYGFTYGVNDTPQVRLSLNVPNAILLNSNLVDAAKVASAGWAFSSDVPTSGVVTVSCLSGGDRVECQGLLGTWDISDADNFSVEAHIQGVLASTALGDVALQAVFTSGDMLKSETRLLTVVRTKDVVIPAAPSNGLVVLKNTPVSMSLECEPTGAGTYLTTTWQMRRLKSDGTHEQWCPIVSNQAGVAAGFIPTQGGIYQVRALASVAAGGTDERFYVWDADENVATGSARRGEPKSFGVVSHMWQKTLRDCALDQLGSTAYLSSELLPAQFGFPEFPAGDLIFKCNIFVAHRIVQSGLMCPKTRGWVNSYPPLANDWANPSYEIGNWIPLTSGECPEPGYVFADPDPDTSGHMGILDFDGAGISAGISNVNRRFDLRKAESVVIRKVEE